MKKKIELTMFSHLDCMAEIKNDIEELLNPYTYREMAFSYLLLYLYLLKKHPKKMNKI